MTVEEAGRVVGYLNAAFPRDALEPESVAIWVAEIAELPHAGAAEEAARTIGRNGDRFPTLKEFRFAYRQAFDRWVAGRQVEGPDLVAPPSPEAVEMLERIRLGDVVRGIDDLPVSTKIKGRPVWERLMRRRAIEEAHGATVVLVLPTDEERADAIRVLAESGLSGGWGDSLHCEAQRIMDEASEA